MDAFCKVVEEALEHVHDLRWLGEQSPLAAPYFLGDLLIDTDVNRHADIAQARGEVLQQLLATSASGLNPDLGRLVEASFFKRNPKLTISKIAQTLDWSRAAYYRQRDAAVREIAAQLSRQMLPSLRLSPPPLPAALIGRDKLLQDGLDWLGQGQSLSLVGRSGAGKTTLGAAIVRAWPGKVFWFTVRTGLNDQLVSLVFALANFLQGCGQANTWRQWVADGGTLNASLTLEQMLGLLRHDLAALNNSSNPQVLLCIDEADLLHQERDQHAQMLHGLEELQAFAPLLLMGQRAVLETNHVVDVPHFDEAQAALLLADLHLDQNRVTQLFAVSKGNPALLRLLAGLCKAGEPIDTLLKQMHTTPTLELLLYRVWKHLQPAERDVLLLLSVYRGRVPLQAFGEHTALLQALAERECVWLDEQGGVVLVSLWQPFVQARIPAEQRVTWHLTAAKMRERFGDWTEAAYHWIGAGRPEVAVWQWFNHREIEIQRGRAQMALTLFQQIDSAVLPHEDDRRVLALLRVELLKMSGAAEEAEAIINAQVWPAQHPITPLAQQLLGDVLEMQGRLDQSLRQFRRAFGQLDEAAEARQQAELARVHLRMGYIHLRERDLDEAQQAAIIAQIQAANFRGHIEEELGRYANAQRHYADALALTQQLRGESTDRYLAQTHSHLGRLSWRLNQTDAAVAHLNSAIELSLKMGDNARALYDRNNLAAAYLVAGDHAAALAQVEVGLALAQALSHAYLIAGFAANAAEACLGLKQLDAAEQHALRCLREEEATYQPYALTVLGQVQQARGDLTGAERQLRQAIALAGMIHDAYAEAHAWRGLAAVLRQREQADEAHAADVRAETIVAKLTGEDGDI